MQNQGGANEGGNLSNSVGSWSASVPHLGQWRTRSERLRCSHTVSVKWDKTRGCVFTHLFKLSFLDRQIKKVLSNPINLKNSGQEYA